EGWRPTGVDRPAMVGDRGLAGPGAIGGEAVIKAERGHHDAAAPRRRHCRRGGRRHRVAAPHRARPFLRNLEKEAGVDPRLDKRGTRPGLPHHRGAAGMSRKGQRPTACREALSRLPELDLSELRQQWRALYKAEPSPHLSRELLVAAIAYRI